MSYVELHARSAFSFLRAASLPEQLVEVAAELELPALALCDRGGVYGTPRFCSAAKQAGVRPILGSELPMEDDSILPVLVENRTGYQNLCRLLTKAHLRSEKGKSKIGWDELPEFTAGLIALTGDEEGPLVAAICDRPLNTNSNAAVTDAPLHVLERLIRTFGRKNVFVEIQRHHIRGEDRINKSLIELAGRCHLPLLATNGVLHANPAGR